MGIQRVEESYIERHRREIKEILQQDRAERKQAVVAKREAEKQKAISERKNAAWQRVLKNGQAVTLLESLENCGFRIADVDFK